MRSGFKPPTIEPEVHKKWCVEGGGFTSSPPPPAVSYKRDTLYMFIFVMRRSTVTAESVQNIILLALMISHQ
jgi:hypothetical protein